MATATQSVKVALILDASLYNKGAVQASQATSKLGRDMDGIDAKSKSMEGSLGKAGGSLKGMSVAAGALAGTALVAFLGDAVTAAGDLEQSIGGVDAVFKDSADTIHAFGKDSAEAVGLSTNEFNKLITVTGAMLKNKGLEDFTQKSIDLVKVGADLAATYGGSAKEAVEALNAAMRGESDPIERYGISLNETAVNAELAAKGLGSLEGAALDQAKAQARIDIITRQSADALGAFGREADTLQGQQQRLTAEWENAKAELGSALLPALTDVMSALRGGVDVAVAAAKAWGELPDPIKAAAAALVIYHLAGDKIAGGATSLIGGLRRVREEMALQQALAGGITGGYQRLGDEAVKAGTKVSNAASLMAVGARTAKVAGSALLGAFGGPLGLAITGITAAIGGFVQAQADARAAAEELAATLDKQTGKFTESTRESFIKKVFGDFNEAEYARIRDSLDQAGVGISDLIAAYETGGPAIDDFKRRFDEWQRTAMAAGGPHSELAADAERIGNAYESVGADLEGARIVFDETAKVQDKVAKATGATADAATKASPKVQKFSESMEDVREDSEKAAAAAREVAEAFLAVADAAVSADKAESDYQAALDDVTAAIKENHETVNKARTELNLNTEAGRDNQAALQDLRDAALANARAMLEQGDSTDKVKSKMDAAERAFVTAAGKMGLNEDAARRMAKEYGLTRGTVDKLAGALDSVKGNYYAKVIVQTFGTEKLQALARAMAVLPGIGGIGAAITALGSGSFASGGYTGRGGKYEPAGIVHKGEYVINQDSTSKLMRDQPGLLASLNQYAQGGYVTRGTAPTSSIDTDQIVSAIAARGGTVINVDSGDRFSPRQIAMKVKSEIDWEAGRG